MDASAFAGRYRKASVMVTGHTGFKGAWLSLWLQEMGARVIGYALDPPLEGSLFETCCLGERLVDLRGDVRDVDHLERAIRAHRPELIFHLAAQPIVRTAFTARTYTFDVNVMGTVNVLEAALQCEDVRAVLVVTSDKCYRNLASESRYREGDELGGTDPYSASKACAELAALAYRAEAVQLAADRETALAIATARAGNVIGGGDWAVDRLIPDTVRAIVGEAPLVLRYPAARRPWQHVLESLSGYLCLGARLADEPQQLAGAFNFGPAEGDDIFVLDVVNAMLSQWPAPAHSVTVAPDASAVEPLLLAVDSSKARHRLGWRPVWNVDRAILESVRWYRAYCLADTQDMYALSREQISSYVRDAADRQIAWAAPASRPEAGSQD